jgi:hypothetical protein
MTSLCRGQTELCFYFEISQYIMFCTILVTVYEKYSRAVVVMIVWYLDLQLCAISAYQHI